MFVVCVITPKKTLKYFLSYLLASTLLLIYRLIGDFPTANMNGKNANKVVFIYSDHERSVCGLTQIALE